MWLYDRGVDFPHTSTVTSKEQSPAMPTDTAVKSISKTRSSVTKFLEGCTSAQKTYSDNFTGSFKQEYNIKTY